MEEELRRLYAEYARVLALQRIRPEDVDGSRLAAHLPFLERLDAIEGSSVALFDLQRQRYAFLTGSFRFLLGYDREEALAQGPPYFYDRMHPADLPVVLDTVTRCFRFLLGTPPLERKDYKLGFDFRIRRADGTLIRLLQQVVVLELDRRGNIWLVLAVNDRIPGGSLEEPATRQLRHLPSGRHFLFAPEDTAVEAGVPLSRREIEILGLVASGLASREIADRLCISVATVNNHRQRILEKTGAKNSSEAVRTASLLGIV